MREKEREHSYKEKTLYLQVARERREEREKGEKRERETREERESRKM